MGDPGPGPSRGRRKSLVDIGRSMGVLDSTESLPKGFETPIAPPTEVLHLTPRSHDVTPGSTSPSIETTSVGTGASIHEVMMPTSVVKEEEEEEKTRTPSPEPQREIEEVPDDGPSLKMDECAEPKREVVFEPMGEEEEREKEREEVMVPAARALSSNKIEVSPKESSVRYGSEDARENERYAHLSGKMAYSATTPNPRTTSSSPLQGALSFFSKIFTPIQELAQAATSSSPGPSTVSQTAPNTPNTHAPLSSPQPFSRSSSDFPRANSSSSQVSIVSTRPTTLPPKSAQEEMKHREQYLAMVQAYEEREAQQKAKTEQKQKMKDERIVAARTMWSSEILRQWEKKKRTKQVHEMVQQGIPSFVRTKVWPLLVGNELHITKDLFNIYVKQAEAGKKAREEGAKQEGKLETAKLIGVDLPRTFPALAFYQEGGPNHSELHRVLDAYVCYRPDIGYVQGMSYLAAILLLYLDDFAAFTCLANLLNRPVHMAFYKMEAELQQYISLFETLFKRILPDLFLHFELIGLSSDMYLLDWFLTIFSKSLPLDTATRLWDIYIFEGQSFFFRASIGILKFSQSSILCQDLDLGPCKRLLARMPESLLDEEALLSCISSISLKEHEELLNQLQVPLFKL